MKTVYKLKDKTTGLYSMGGVSNKFNKQGKIWKSKGHLINHLKQFIRSKENILYKNMNNWIVIEYEIHELSESDLFSFMSNNDPKIELDLLSSINRSRS